VDEADIVATLKFFFDGKKFSVASGEISLQNRCFFKLF